MIVSRLNAEKIPGFLLVRSFFDSGIVTKTIGIRLISIESLNSKSFKLLSVSDKAKIIALPTAQGSKK